MQRVNHKVKTLKTKRKWFKMQTLQNALTINLTFISRKSKPRDGLFKLTQNNFIQRANSLHWIQLWSHKALFTLLPDTWCSLKRCKTSELLTYDMNLIVNSHTPSVYARQVNVSLYQLFVSVPLSGIFSSTVRLCLC